LIGCTTTDVKTVATSAAQRAVIETPVNLPDWPAYCREEIPKVIPKLGEKWRWTEYRHQVVWEQANARIIWCAQWYDKRQDEAARGIQSPR
jgi:hypothetical protein